MARPITNTPILKGKEAKKFFEHLHATVNEGHSFESKNARKAELERMKAGFDFIQSLSK